MGIYRRQIAVEKLWEYPDAPLVALENWGEMSASAHSYKTADLGRDASIPLSMTSLEMFVLVTNLSFCHAERRSAVRRTVLRSRSIPITVIASPSTDTTPSPSPATSGSAIQPAQSSLPWTNPSVASLAPRLCGHRRMRPNTVVVRYRICW